MCTTLSAGIKWGSGTPVSFFILIIAPDISRYAGQIPKPCKDPDVHRYFMGSDLKT